jgi:hypothetical protein
VSLLSWGWKKEPSHQHRLTPPAHSALTRKQEDKPNDRLSAVLEWWQAGGILPGAGLVWSSQASGQAPCREPSARPSGFWSLDKTPSSVSCITSSHLRLAWPPARLRLPVHKFRVLKDPILSTPTLVNRCKFLCVLVGNIRACMGMSRP